MAIKTNKKPAKNAKWVIVFCIARLITSNECDQDLKQYCKNSHVESERVRGHGFFSEKTEKDALVTLYKSLLKLTISNLRCFINKKNLHFHVHF